MNRGVGAGFGLLMIAACTSSSRMNQAPMVSDARHELVALVGDVTKADGYRYGVTDDQGHVMDTAKIIEVANDEFAAVYHWWNESAHGFRVSLATSTDLLKWTWRVDLGEQASQPTIRPSSDGGYVVAWEQEPDNHLRFIYYRTWDDLVRGTSAKVFDAKRQLSDCAEGTPNLYSASSRRVEFGFHYFARCETDQQARGTTDWTSWQGTEQPLLNRAAWLQGYRGSVGDRDVIEYRGHEFTFLEAQFLQGDWRTFRVLLYDEETQTADPVASSVHVFISTHQGSFSYTNLSVSEVNIRGRRALVVGLFIPSEGAQGDEAGQLIFYKTIEG